MRYRNWLVVLTILKNMKVNGKDYPIYYGKNVPNHQPGNSNVIVKYRSRIVLDLFIFGSHMGIQGSREGIV